MNDGLPWRSEAATGPVIAFDSHEIDLPGTDFERQAVAGGLALAARRYNNVAGPRPRTKLKGDLLVRPDRIVVDRPAAHRHPRTSPNGAKALAPNRDKGAFIILSTAVGAAFQVGKEDPWLALA